MTKKLLIRVLSYLRDNDKNNKENVDEEEVTLKEECLNMAENLVVCRGCLATNTKLYELHENNLKDLFREVVGSPFQDIESDHLPPYICTYCHALLLKYTAFRRRCRRAQDILEEIEFHGGEVTTEFIASIDRPYYNLNLNLSISNPVVMDSEDVENETEVEYINESADEKPFVKLVFFEESPKDGIELDDVCNEYIVETEDVVTSETDLITTTKLDEPDKVDKPPKNSWCIYCGESFLNDVGLRNHKRKAHFDLPTTQFSCDSCDISFLNAEALQLHVDNICFNSANCCVHCGDSFESEMYLKFHILQMHRKVNRNMMKCDTCYAEFDTTKALSTHLSLTNGDCRGLSSCLQCGESFMTTSLMKKHVADSHLNVYDCQKCEESFPTIYTYGKHFEAAHMVDKNRRPSRLTGPKKWGVVSVAGARVIAGGDAATADTVAVCEYCGQICTNDDLLEYHQMIHRRDKPYRCVFCQKGFTTPILLKQHIRVHTGERPHKCEYCPKMFKSRSALNRHTLIHTGERNHVCQLCGKDFITSTSVKTHIKTVHMKIPGPPRERRKKRVD